MRRLVALFFLMGSPSVLADVATFSTESQLLEMPLLVINGSAYYRDVVLHLDQTTGQYTIMSAHKADLEDIGAQTVTLSLEMPGVLFTQDTLTVLDIQDSRCPTGVLCIVAGEVVVGLQLQNHITDGITLMDLTLEGNGDIPGETVETESYSFRLLEVSPYPVADEPLADTDYSITIEYTLKP